MGLVPHSQLRRTPQVVLMFLKIGNQRNWPVNIEMLGRVGKGGQASKFGPRHQPRIPTHGAFRGMRDGTDKATLITTARTG